MAQDNWSTILKKRRQELKKSQQQLVTDSGNTLKQPDVSRMERGLTHPTHTLGTDKFFGLLKALEWTIEQFSDATGISVPFYTETQAHALSQASRLEVSADWLRFPVYGSVSAGQKNTEPLYEEMAFIPRDKLRAKGADPASVRVYLVNGDCMISNEAQRIQKNIAPGDYVAVDTSRKPQPGDTVVAWWPQEEKMVVKRYKIEGSDIVLYPVNPAHPNLVLAHEEDVYILGSVIWRGG